MLRCVAEELRRALDLQRRDVLSYRDEEFVEHHEGRYHDDQPMRWFVIVLIDVGLLRGQLKSVLIYHRSISARPGPQRQRRQAIIFRLAAMPSTDISAKGRVH
jgi:hypothetical protein